MPGNQLCRFVLRVIINDDYFEVAVVLLEKRLYVPGISIVFNVVVSGSDNTGSYLFAVIINFIFLLKVSLLFFMNYLCLWILGDIFAREHGCLEPL
jgi:hypothetical protein